MRKTVKTSSGKILAEMNYKEWKSFLKKNPNPEDLDPEDLGALMVAYRNEHGLTQRDLGEKLGISRNTVSNIEKGIMSDISQKTYSSVYFTYRLMKCMVDDH
jgi:DNA-binding XRE family transcriptional regulator